MFKSKSNLKHFINLLNFFLKNYFFCRKSISEPADGPWLKSIFFYSNGFLFWLRKKIMEHLSVLADIYSMQFFRNIHIIIIGVDDIQHRTKLIGNILTSTKKKLKLKLTNSSINQKDLVRKYCSVFTPNEKIEF